MQAKSLIDTAVPTPFGWVATQPEFDLKAILAFQTQLLALHRACGATPVLDSVTESVTA